MTFFPQPTRQEMARLIFDGLSPYMGRDLRDGDIDLTTGDITLWDHLGNEWALTLHPVNEAARTA